MSKFLENAILGFIFGLLVPSLLFLFIGVVSGENQIRQKLVTLGYAYYEAGENGKPVWTLKELNEEKDPCEPNED